MKMRADLYAGEAAEILKIVSTYKTLKYEQLSLLFPDKRDTVKIIINKLEKQQRLCVNTENNYVIVDDNESINQSMVKAFWVFLDFYKEVQYHTNGEFPAQISFFTEKDYFEIIDVPYEQEALVSQALQAKNSDIKRIVIVEELTQIRKINISSTYYFCKVYYDGKVDYFRPKGG